MKTILISCTIVLPLYKSKTPCLPWYRMHRLFSDIYHGITMVISGPSWGYKSEFLIFSYAMVCHVLIWFFKEQHDTYTVFKKLDWLIDWLYSAQKYMVIPLYSVILLLVKLKLIWLVNWNIQFICVIQKSRVGIWEKEREAIKESNAAILWWQHDKLVIPKLLTKQGKNIVVNI